MRKLPIPDISIHTKLWLEAEVSNKLSWQDEEYEKLVMLLFDSTPWRDKENLRLDKITLSLLRGGRSSVSVLKLVFIHKKQPYGFIIRIHPNLKDAEAEKNYADKLDINSIDCFANCMGQKELAGQYLVIYQDVGVNMVTKSIDELSESLLQRLSSQDEFTVFAHNFQTLIEDVTQSFEKITDSKTISHDEYYDEILSQLPPELVINQAHLYQSDDLIFKSQISIQDEIKKNEIIDIHQLIHRLSEKNTATQWFKLNEIWFDENQSILTGDNKEIAYLPFTIEENSKIVYLWIAINKNELKDIESKLETTLDATRSCQLIFLAEDITFTAQLKKMGFDTQSCLATLDFQALCEKDYSQLHLDMRHNDLHCGNVLTSGNSFKIIDVGDMRADLIASDIARLEVSLWFEISKRLSEFSEQAAKTVIENLMTDDVSNTNSLSISTRFSDFLRHLRKGFEVGVQPDKTEIVLAYVIQILLYQRYSLLDGVSEIPVAFNVFCAYWLNQFRPQSSSKEELTPPQLPETSKEKENMREIQTPPQHPPLEQIGGAVPLDSKFYVERQTDKTFQDMIARRDSIVLLKGARQVGKTSLLARGLDAARQTGMCVLSTDFQKLVDNQLQNLDTFFIAIGQMLARQMGLKVKPQDVWQTDYSPHLNFEDFFIDEILAASEKPVLWAIDETDRFFLYPFSSQVFALFRSWHNQRAYEPTNPCSRLTLVITYATEYLLIKDPNQSPFNVGTKLMLEDFNLEQMADLNQRYGSPLRHDSELRHFHNLLGGQPYLVRCGLNDIVSRNLTLDEFIQTAEHDDGTFSDHLRRIVLLLNDNKQLSEVIRGMLRGKPCPDYDSFNYLRGAGILKGDSKNDVSFRCEIYESYLHKHLL